MSESETQSGNGRLSDFLDETDVAEPRPDSETTKTYPDGTQERVARCHHCEDRIRLIDGEWLHVETDEAECDL